MSVHKIVSQQLLQIKAKISGLEESKEDVQLYEKLLRISDSEKEEASRQIADLRNQNYQLTNNRRFAKG